MSEELIIEEIETNREEYVNFLTELIQADSYNPPGNENNVAVIIERFLNEAGIKCEIFRFGDNRANLMACLNNNKEGKNLLFNGHMDIVPPGVEEEWKKPPLSAFIKRKKIMYGRGTTDMKGGLAAMVIALKILKSLGLELSGNLILNAVADEETGGKLGTKWLLENILLKREIKCDFAVIGEPSGLNPLPKAIILGEKGHLQVKIITNGISCHSSTPFLGKNAIYMMSDIIQNLDKLEDAVPKIDPPMKEDELKKMVSDAFPSEEIFERIYNDQPLLQNVIKANVVFTNSLNMISGGIKENVVPDKCESVIDFRLLPGLSSEVVLNALKKTIEELGYPVKDGPTGKPEEIFVYLEIFHQSEASVWFDWRDSKELKDFFSVVEKVYKKKPFYFLFPACADAHYYRNSYYGNSGFCPATILFGPGSAVKAHSTDEFIEIQDFLDAIKVYAIFAHNFIK